MILPPPQLFPSLSQLAVLGSVVQKGTAASSAKKIPCEGSMETFLQALLPLGPLLCSQRLLGLNPPKSQFRTRTIWLWKHLRAQGRDQQLSTSSRSRQKPGLGSTEEESRA